MTQQQRRLRRENFCEENSFVPFSEKTCDIKATKIEYYGTIQDLYDYEYDTENRYYDN